MEKSLDARWTTGVKHTTTENIVCAMEKFLVTLSTIRKMVEDA